MRAKLAILALLCATSLTGCHCCRLSPATEHFADRIDDCSDKDVCLDCYYCEKLDVTRWCIDHRRCCGRCR